MYKYIYSKVLNKIIELTKGNWMFILPVIFSNIAMSISFNSGLLGIFSGFMVLLLAVIVLGVTTLITYYSDFKQEYLDKKELESYLSNNNSIIKNMKLDMFNSINSDIHYNFEIKKFSVNAIEPIKNKHNSKFIFEKYIDSTTSYLIEYNIECKENTISTTYTELYKFKDDDVPDIIKWFDGKLTDPDFKINYELELREQLDYIKRYRFNDEKEIKKHFDIILMNLIKFKKNYITDCNRKLLIELTEHNQKDVKEAIMKAKIIEQKIEGN